MRKSAHDQTAERHGRPVSGTGRQNTRNECSRCQKKPGISHFRKFQSMPESERNRLKLPAKSSPLLVCDSCLRVASLANKEHIEAEIEIEVVDQEEDVEVAYMSRRDKKAARKKLRAERRNGKVVVTNQRPARITEPKPTEQPYIEIDVERQIGGLPVTNSVEPKSIIDTITAEVARSNYPPYFQGTFIPAGYEKGEHTGLIISSEDRPHKNIPLEGPCAHCSTLEIARTGNPNAVVYHPWQDFAIIRNYLRTSCRNTVSLKTHTKNEQIAEARREFTARQSGSLMTQPSPVRAPQGTRALYEEQIKAGRQMSDLGIDISQVVDRATKDLNLDDYQIEGVDVAVSVERGGEEVALDPLRSLIPFRQYDAKVLLGESFLAQVEDPSYLNIQENPVSPLELQRAGLYLLTQLGAAAHALSDYEGLEKELRTIRRQSERESADLAALKLELEAANKWKAEFGPRYDRLLREYQTQEATITSLKSMRTSDAEMMAAYETENARLTAENTKLKATQDAVNQARELLLKATGG